MEFQSEPIPEILSSLREDWEKLRANENIVKDSELKQPVKEKSKAVLDADPQNAEAWLYLGWSMVPNAESCIDFSKALRYVREENREEYKLLVSQGLVYMAKVAIGSSASLIQLKDTQNKLEILENTLANQYYIPVINAENAANVMQACNTYITILRKIVQHGDFSAVKDEELKSSLAYLQDQSLSIDLDAVGEYACTQILAVAELGKYPAKSHVLSDHFVQWLQANSLAEWMLNETLKAGYATDEETLGKIYDALEELSNHYINSTGYKIQNKAFVAGLHPTKENIEKAKETLAKYKKERWEVIGKAVKEKANAYWQEHPEELIRTNEELAQTNEKIQGLNAEMSAFMDRIDHVPAKEEITQTKQKINQLKQEFSRLGLFQGGKKRAIQEVIGQLEASLPGLESTVKEQQQALLPEKPDLSSLDALKERLKELKLVMDYPAKYHHLIEKKEDQR